MFCGVFTQKRALINGMLMLFELLKKRNKRIPKSLLTMITKSIGIVVQDKLA